MPGHESDSRCRGDFERYQERDFPVYSLTKDEKRQKLLDLLVADHARIIDEKGQIKQTMHGLALAWHYHPYMWNVKCGDRMTPLDVFRDELLFHKATAKMASFGYPATNGGWRKVLRIFSGTQSVSNFRPTAAAAVYHRLLPEDGGVVWDMCAGFGGRLLGALACDRVDKYIGTDPDTHTMQGLREMADELVPMAEQFGRRTLDVELHQTGSEVFVPQRNSLDVAFTSPPYAGWEQYSNEPTQSHKRFPTQDSWLRGFMGATLRNCAHGLRRNGTLALNIANVAGYPSLARDFVAYAERNGWRLVETMRLSLSKMVGQKHKHSRSYKYEPIFIFKKK
jgi:hypothetical protein